MVCCFSASYDNKIMCHTTRCCLSATDWGNLRARPPTWRLAHQKGDWSLSEDLAVHLMLGIASYGRKIDCVTIGELSRPSVALIVSYIPEGSEVGAAAAYQFDCQMAACRPIVGCGAWRGRLLIAHPGYLLCGNGGRGSAKYFISHSSRLHGTFQFPGGHRIKPLLGAAAEPHVS
jgi:hypothetical protein